MLFLEILESHPEIFFNLHMSGFELCDLSTEEITKNMIKDWQKFEQHTTRTTVYKNLKDWRRQTWPEEEEYSKCYHTMTEALVPSLFRMYSSTNTYHNHKKIQISTTEYIYC